MLSSLRVAIDELSFALDEIDTHWAAMEGLLRAHLLLVQSQPVDSRLLSGDYSRAELGDEESYVQHEIQALLKNRDLIREKHKVLRSLAEKAGKSDAPVDPNRAYSCCPGEHSFEKWCLATPPCFDPSCPEERKVCSRCRNKHRWTA